MSLKILAAAFSLFLPLTTLCAHAADSDPTPSAASFEGTYERQGAGCAYAAQVVFSEETDSTTDLVIYHLRLLRDDGRVWNSREFRQLNGLPWYKADVGNDATVSGRSRYLCAGSDCTLSNEHNTCKGFIFPRCTGWGATREDEVVFEGGSRGTTMTLSTDGDSICTYVKR